MVACDKTPPAITPDTTIASLGTPADNEIWFTTNDNRPLFTLNEEAFNAEIVDIEYSEFGVNVIRFAESVTTIGERAFDNCRNLYNISLPESVTTIGERAFFECTDLECITLGSQIKRCGRQAFDNCIALHSLHIASIGYWCQIEFADPMANPLYYCGQFVVNNKKISDLVVPDWVSHISDYALYNYTMLSSVTIPKGVKSIGADAFYGCENLTRVSTNDITAWCDIDFANVYANPLSIAGSIYIGDQPATAVALQGVERVKARAFYGCCNINSFSADGALKTVGEEAFRGCFELRQVDLGSNINSIEGRAFMGCTALNSVTIMASNPPALGDKYVFDYNADGRKIYVPKEAYNIYKADPMWSRYADSIEALN